MLYTKSIFSLYVIHYVIYFYLQCTDTRIQFVWKATRHIKHFVIFIFLNEITLHQQKICNFMTDQVISKGTKHNLTNRNGLDVSN